MNLVVSRILDLVEKSGLTDQVVVQKSELSRTAISDWRREKAKPSIDAIIKLAKFFNVSTDYLLTGTEKKPSLSQEDSDWLALLHELPSDERQSCFIYMQGFVDGANRNRNNNYKRQEKAVGE